MDLQLQTNCDLNFHIKKKKVLLNGPLNSRTKKWAPHKVGKFFGPDNRRQVVVAVDLPLSLSLWKFVHFVDEQTLSHLQHKSLFLSLSHKFFETEIFLWGNAPRQPILPRDGLLCHVQKGRGSGGQHNTSTSSTASVRDRVYLPRWTYTYERVALGFLR